MTATATISLLAAAIPPSTATAAPTHLDPLQLFLDADIVVQIVMLGLILASVWVWAIIVSFSMKVGKLDSKNRHFEKNFWRSDNPDALIASIDGELPSRNVAEAGLAEWRASTEKGVADRDGARSRISQAMDAAVTLESDRLAARLNFLATVGSVAPFVGLFGTVWGIMNSFFQIGAQSNTSLAVVAPGISEALFATAIGLFAAIPAVIAYNRFSFRVNSFETKLYRFADKLNASLSRELERM
ncbi:protein TolQ [Croceicoccus mobilis]|uniref:Tol-Pal system subunit TolQ n=1 Tax=Croceicoccus mobilis TaxID=1703339 RepID=A0A917DT07_9SPHN|nr:protein TolQ [Croceicoccus mobilis]GGD68280.1 Tol-Pal system subunit TolQ [Croceicoccus mobilis]